MSRRRALLQQELNHHLAGAYLAGLTAEVAFGRVLGLRPWGKLTIFST